MMMVNRERRLVCLGACGGDRSWLMDADTPSVTNARAALAALWTIFLVLSAKDVASFRSH